ncbi:MAG TPA: class F sortase [Nocardioidaceae bacterium]|nr:class F sortase [Nocardioidaceae bacterium]
MRTTRGAALIALLGVIGLVVSLAAVWPRLGPGPEVLDPQPGPPAAGPARTTNPAPGGAGPGRNEASLDAPTAPSVTRPVQVNLGSVGVDLPVRPVGVAKDGQMQLPPDPRVMGWYRYGPAPGASTGGSVVVAGHLDSRRLGLGPLVRLRDLRLGDKVVVTTSDGATSTYTIREIERFDRRALPAEVFSRSGPERLRIVTCGGEYDPEAGGYQQNLVVTAVPA